MPRKQARRTRVSFDSNDRIIIYLDHDLQDDDQWNTINTRNKFEPNSYDTTKLFSSFSF